MSSFSTEYWSRLADVYNDTINYPRVSDAAAALGIATRTLGSHVTLLRGLSAADKSLPKLVSRLGKAATEPAAGDAVRSIETVPVSADEPMEDLLERIFSAQGRYDDFQKSKDVVDISIKVEGPYGVVGIPDHHLNNIGTNTKQAFEDAFTIAKHPALFGVGIGDWLDNFIVGFLERERRKDVISHSDSWRLLEHYIEILAPKLIVAISGNHMDWTTSAGGYDVTKRLFVEKGLGAVYDPDQVRVRLKSPNGATFTHLARHKYRGNSRFNSVHAITVHILERWEGEDVVWGGHIHVAGHVSMEKKWQGEGRVVHGVQLGAYKVHDNYAKREHFRPNQPFLTPITVHDPANGKTYFFEDMKAGIFFLDALRKERGL